MHDRQYILGVNAHDAAERGHRCASGFRRAGAVPQPIDEQCRDASVEYLDSPCIAAFYLAAQRDTHHPDARMHHRLRIPGSDPRTDVGNHCGATTELRVDVEVIRKLLDALQSSRTRTRAS